MNIGVQKVKRMVAEKMWTQEQLARAAGVSRATINSALLKGSCSIRTVSKISKALDIEPKEIIDKEE